MEIECICILCLLLNKNKYVKKICFPIDLTNNYSTRKMSYIYLSRKLYVCLHAELDSACNTANGQPVCTVTNSECQNNVCKCKQGYREIDAACEKGASKIWFFNY